MSACSTGIGGPATAIAIEELAAIGGDTFLRVGSCGALRKEIDCGDLVIVSAAMRDDGTSGQYVPPAYPAAANIDVTLALIEAAEHLGFRYHVGYTASSDSFYVGQGRPAFRDFPPPCKEGIIDVLRNARVLVLEMEASTIFTLAGIYGLRSGCICAVYANRATDQFKIAGEENACRTAVEAAKILTRWDKDREVQKRSHWYPSLSFVMPP